MLAATAFQRGLPFGRKVWKKGEIAMKRLIAILLLGLFLALPCAASAAVFNQPRDYIPAPPDTFVIMTYFQHITAQSAFVNGHQVANDAGLTENVGLFRPFYFMKLGPFIIDPNVIIPFGNVSVNSGSGLGAVNTQSTGFGDILAICTFWLWHKDKTNTYAGVTPILIAPTGVFNSDKTVNFGGNRWSGNIQGFFVKGWEVIPGHKLYAEAEVMGQFYGNNTRFFNPAFFAGRRSFQRHGSLSQEPELDFEGHLSYDIIKTVFASFDYYGQLLGKQSFEGVSLGNSLSNHTLGWTVAYSFAPGFQLMLQYQAAIPGATNTGTLNNTILARFLWATDGKSLRRAVGAQ
jgi:hypothetical protein